MEMQMMKAAMIIMELLMEQLYLKTEMVIIILLIIFKLLIGTQEMEEIIYIFRIAMNLILSLSP